MEESQSKTIIASKVPDWLGVAFAAGIVAVFYFLVPGFGPGESHSPLVWLWFAWNSETDMEQGYLLPIIVIGLFVWQWKALRNAVEPSTRKGLPVLLIGAVLFVISHHTGQARLAVAALPLVLWGGIWFLWGWKVARLSFFFPLLLLILAIPFPQFHQLSFDLQVLSNKLAQIGSGWCGVEVELCGTGIYSTDGSFAPLEIAQGCSGNRSFLHLFVIASVWAYLSKLAWWKKCLFVLAVVPIEIFCNALRLTSIFAIAKYGDLSFARTTWHDWSGLLLFYPAALILLFVIYRVLRSLGTQQIHDSVSESGRPAISVRNRSLVLSGLLGIILSLVFVLPPIKMTKSAMSLELPNHLGAWVMKVYPPSHVELGIHSYDTEFAKSACFVERDEERSFITGEAPVDRADLSIVLSGHELSKSVHRPERCLHAQGHQELQVSSAEITLKNGLPIPIKRILSTLRVDEATVIDSLNYYAFIGHSDITTSHFERTLIDLKDRVFKAEEQRWAYLTVSMRYVDQADPPFGSPPNLEAADKKLRDLFRELMEKNVDWELIGS